MPVRLSIALILTLATSVVSAAAFNTRISEQTVPLNGSVRLTFSTTQPDNEHVNITAVVNQALELEAVRAKWRLLETPVIKQHAKAKDVQVSILLAPRLAGQLSLPEIPVKWMDGNRSATFPVVTIENHLALGGTTIAAPKEMNEIGGYTWGMTLSDYEKAAKVDLKDGPDVHHESRPGLVLHFQGRMLAAGKLRLAGMSLAEAKPMLMQRWGDPAVDTGSKLAWNIGWVAITASTADDGTILVDLIHEGVAAAQRRAQVRAAVFDLLDGTDKKAAGEDAAKPSPQKPAAGVEDDEIEAEVERAMREKMKALAE